MAVGALYTAMSGLTAQRRVIDTASTNVANQMTPGYRRQVVDLVAIGGSTSASVFAGPGTENGGVDVRDVRRVIDDLAEFRAREAVAVATDATATFDNMIQIENVFGEPGETGLASQFDQFWVSWSDLADRADDPVERGEVLSQASSIVSRFQAASAGLDEIDADAARRLGTMATEVNTIAAQVADLNRSIASSPSSPNRLLDERDDLAAKLVSLLGAEVQPTQRGMVGISVGGRLLVGDGLAYEVRSDGADLVWDTDGSPIRGGAGELAALQRLRTETIPSVSADLDAVVESFVTEVNAAHRDGYGLDGVTGRDFFDPAGLTAQTVEVSTDMLDNPDWLAAGAPVLPGPTAPGAFDGRQAQVLGDLAVSGTATASYRSFVAGLGIQTNSASRRAETSQRIADRSIDEAESVSGVSLDEEMANMMAAQRAYEASARMIRTVDEMLETVIGLIR